MSSSIRNAKLCTASRALYVPYLSTVFFITERERERETERERERERERNVLFNDDLNTFYLRLYGVRHMVKDHSDSEKGNLLPPHRLLLSINSKDYEYIVAHTML